MKFESRVTQKWFCSILVVVACILLVALALCAYLLQGLRQNVLQISSDTTGYLQNSVDSRLYEIQKNSILFELDTTNSKIKRMDTPPAETLPEVYQFCEQLRSFRISSKLVKNIFIYYPKIDCVAGNLGFYPANSYFSLLNSDPEGTFFDWRPTGSGAETMQLVYTQQQGVTHFLYMRSMKYNGEVVGVIVVDIDPVELLRGTQTMGGSAGEISAFGLVLDNQIVVSSGAPSTLQAMQRVVEGMSVTEGTLSGQGILAYLCPSAFVGLWYITGYPQNHLFAPIYTAAIVCGIGIVSCLLAGMYYSLQISRRNAKPLVSILQKLPGFASEGLDEYQYINAKLDQLLQERFTRQERLQEQQYMIDSLFLNTVLQGQMQKEYAIFSAAQRYEVMFENPMYQVAVLECGAAKEHHVRVLKEVCEAEGIEAMVAMVAQKNQRLVLLLNLETALDEWAATRVARLMLARLPKPAACAFGLGYDTLVGIYTSYGEAVAALPAKAEGNSFGFFSRGHRREGLKRQQGLAAMEEFTRQLGAGRYEKAALVMPDILADYFDAGAPPAETRRRVATLQTLLLDALEKHKLAGGKVPPSLVKQLVDAASREQLQPCAEHSLILLAKKQPVQLGAEGSIPQRAKEIIKQNFTDPMLGLYMVSDQLGVSNTYLSTSFKATFKVGVIQYINELRIDQAKGLILATDMSIKEIAHQVGFASDISFIRVFKKYEKKTPTALRKAEKYFL